MREAELTESTASVTTQDISDGSEAQSVIQLEHLPIRESWTPTTPRYSWN